jgi:hypothetical protein
MWFSLPGATSAFQEAAPRVSEITVKKITLVENDPSKASVVFNITGEKFGKAVRPVVKLFNQETGAGVDATVMSNDDNAISASAQVPVGKTPTKYVFQVSVNNVNIIPPDRLADFTLEVVKEEKKQDDAPKPFEITFETFKSEQYPNLYSLVITNKNQNSVPGFSPNPALMKVDIVPPGATNVTVQPGSSPYQMLVTFLAPEKFDVKNVAVTVFDPNSTLGNSRPSFFSTPFKEKPAKGDPNQPTISNVEILSMQRRSGFGRLKIEGSGFGDYVRPPYSGERELLCCIGRPSNTAISTEFSDRRLSVENRDAKGNTVTETFIDPNVCPSDGKTCQTMRDWRRRIEERVNVILTPRNPDLRIERTHILYIDDKTIDVYFEFTRYENYSQPLRLANVTVTVNKGSVQAAQASDANDKREVLTAVLSGPKTYVATRDVGAARDKNLEYRYVVMDHKDAGRLFGRGVGDNFYVIELSVINNGKKKVAIPLGSIQAEAEWLYGFDGGKGVDYDEGPPTIPALPLGAVSGYFDAFQKSEGWRARVFNILDGVTTLGTSLVPVFGRNIERPTSILAGGFIPGLRKAVGDLSSEQLQRLTTMSWENVEEVPSGGGKSKFIYIPRADQFFGNGKEKPVKKKLVSIRGIEVSGFEIIESEQRLATQQQ